MDILIPLGDESSWQNNELRYCLRSIERFATGFQRIFVVGENPRFLNGETVISECREVAANREARIAHKILWAFEHTDVSDDAVIFNDDYVLLAPVNLATLPSYQRGDLIEDRIVWHGYRASLLATRRALIKAGKPTLHYDIHVPIIYSRAAYIGLRDWWDASYKMAWGMVVKSVYCNNVLSQPGPYMADCKLRNFDVHAFDNQLAGRFVFSYNDNTLRHLKPWLQQAFPEKSRWEM